MNDFVYTVEVTGLSPKATEKDVYDFFAFSGAVEHVEIVRSGEYASIAYVTFKNAYSQETAILLSGATLLDQRIFISRWGQYKEEFDFSGPSRSQEDEASSWQPPLRSQFVSHAGEAVSFAQDAVKAMMANGYVLGKDALSKAKAFDESHQVSATAAAKVAELSERIGLTDKLRVGVDAVRSVDERYHVSKNAKSAISAAGRTAAAAGETVVSSSYFSLGALWVSGASEMAAKAAADLGNRGVHQ
ncbi:binding partner of ACD11 1-like [Hibiscus syriacus]|uniref:binding partner of ACD11 1-like n=1 Tax=Hibiscus syriacus TaxID=106335 RepID=UPI001923C397|nr:binding partner of ACD11 1-like [Hibiscus syriacus]